MEKKKLHSLFSATLIIATLMACSEDPVTNLASPMIITPAATTVQVGKDVVIDFNYVSAAGFASSSVTATGGSAMISTDGNLGDTAGSISVTFTAGTTEGAGSITLTITDAEGDTGNSTVVLTVALAPTVFNITSNITSNTTWETGKTYILKSRIAVVSGITLTIQPGVVVKGEAGSGANATALLIARGGKLMAEGTASQPIIFTSTADQLQPGQIKSPNLDPDFSGLWGGLIILGKAPISAPGSVEAFQIEGIPPSDQNGLYGGTDPADNSGVIKYISIRHGGTNIGEGNEINGLTLGGVGSGTLIENIEIVANQDDGIEYFGGTVNVKNALVWNVGDDGMDTDQAWSGTLDNFIVIGGADTDHAMEIDGPEGSFLGTPHTLKNGSIKIFTTGSPPVAGPGGGEIADLRSNARANFENIYIFNLHGGSDWELDNAGVSANYLAGLITFLNIQINTSNLTSPPSIATIFKDDGGNDAQFNADAAGFASIVTTPTTGATKSVFSGWTWADANGELSSF